MAKLLIAASLCLAAYGHSSKTHGHTSGVSAHQDLDLRPKLYGSSDRTKRPDGSADSSNQVVYNCIDLVLLRAAVDYFSPGSTKQPPLAKIERG